MEPGFGRNFEPFGYAKVEDWRENDPLSGRTRRRNRGLPADYAEAVDRIWVTLNADVDPNNAKGGMDEMGRMVRCPWKGPG